MQKSTLLTFTLGLFTATTALATVWQVGPTKNYTAPSAVSGLVANGDTIEIDATTYMGDVCSWTKNNLLIKGVGNGRAVLNANGNNQSGKAIWVTVGQNITIENIEFLNATVPDQNGAGIRTEGSNLTVRNCYFHHNENGVLGGLPGSTIKFYDTEFAYNGYGDGYSHNMYINHVDTFVIVNCYSHHAVIGHELKSRANTNFIYNNRLMNEASGTASREIDLSNGGFTIIMGNLVQQGPNTSNSGMLGYGLEGLNNPSGSELNIINNTFVNERGSGGTYVHVQNGISKLKMNNNIFVGASGAWMAGTPTVTDSSNNWYTTDVNGVGITSYANYDYHLMPSSPAINKGAALTSTQGFSLVPQMEYSWPNNVSVRPVNGMIDLGAFEYAGPTAIKKNVSSGGSFLITNINGIINFWYDNDALVKSAMVFDINGRLVEQMPSLTGDHYTLTSTTLAPGLYTVRFICGDMVSVRKFVIN